MKIPKLDFKPASAKPAVVAPANIKFLDRVKVKEKLSDTIILEGSEHIKFYANAKGQVIRFNIEDGTLVVLLDTPDSIKAAGHIMEVFMEGDLEPLVD